MTDTQDLKVKFAVAITQGYMARPTQQDGISLATTRDRREEFARQVWDFAEAMVSEYQNRK